MSGKLHHQARRETHSSMIPVPIFSGAFFIVLGLSFLATIAVVFWGAALGLVPAARRSFGRHRGRSIGILAVLCAASLFFVCAAVVWLGVDRESRKEQAALHPTLTAPATLLGVNMPVGTQLSLRDATDMTSLDEAHFPHAVSVFAISAIALSVRSEGDDEAPQDAPSPTNLPAMELIIASMQMVDGWTCGASEPLEVVLRHDARIKTPYSCQLAAGNAVAQSPIPDGSRLIRSTTAYGDGLRDNDYWRIDVVDDGVFELEGLPLRHPTLRLDRQRNVMAVEYAVLARDTRLGDISYPAGTAVSTGLRGVREKHPGAWVFRPVQGHPAHGKDHGDIAEGMSVVQAIDGKVQAIMPN
ncbi:MULTISPECIES: hypothetical protein [unclassified Dyella]|uniref:hypothetical protein n=1 Tax=unclassified Dyella TaxID=2634549 RepID=UPI0011AF93A8|nr:MULTISPECIES: hypothetical protein [unclassified Dyella]MDR3443665.1 hypothetical protein [Dyella sp.]